MFHSPNEAARAGAVLLDSQVPGWAEKINLEHLDVRCGGSCVLAQISGADFIDGRRMLGLARYEATIDNGFFVHGDQEAEPVIAEYEALTEAWAHEVRQRIAA